MNYRIRKLRAAMEGMGLKAMLLSSPADVFYYTGYWPSTTCFLLIGEQPVLFVHRIENGAERLKCKTVVIKETKDIRPWLAGQIGFDENSLKARDYAILKRGLRPAGLLAASIRAVKEADEIEAIRAAQRTVRTVWPKRLVGRSEEWIARSVIVDILKRGSRPAFEPIIAAGPNGWYIHHSPGRRAIKSYDLVVVDIGVRQNYYCSDMTRTFCARPGKREKAIVQNVANIQGQLIDMMADSVAVKDVTELYERLLAKAGYKALHGWGHSIGLEPHEFFGERIRAGMMLTVEPGIYIKGFGGCRIEDIVLIKRNKAKPI